jgi:subtilisin family serine protease
MTTALPVRASALALSLALAACSGGGGGSTGAGGGIPPTPTPTSAYIPCSTGSAFTKTSLPTTGPLTLPKPSKLSTFTFNSNPTGVPVTITFPNATTTQGLGPAPVATQPPVAFTPYNVTWSGSAAPFTVAIDQSQNGDHSLIYNQASDTNGTINLSTIASGARSTQSGTGTRSARTDDNQRAVQRQNGRPSLSAQRLFVRYDTSFVRTSHAHLIASEKALGVTAPAEIGEFNGVTVREVTIPESQTIAQATRQLRALPGVKSVERVHLRYASSCAGLTANNPHFLLDQQWDMYQIGAPNAWGYTKGDAITIAVIDTGIDNNSPQLTGKLTYQEQVVGGVKTTGGQVAQDTNGHGTNVAGIALAQVNDGLGFAGVGYNVKLQAYKIFPNDSPTGPGDPPGADTGDESVAIRDAVANGADVINLSLGSQQDTLYPDGTTGVDIVEHDAIEYAISQGVAVVAAAGNEGAKGVANLDYPANDDNVISVGATSLHDNNTGIPSPSNQEYVTPYSNSAPSLSVVAPGGDPIDYTTDSDYLHWIYNISTTTATNPINQCKKIADCKAFFAGTSQATPHVSGTIALMLAAAGGRKSLTVGQITQLIQSTADNINDPKQGHGRINAYRAIAAAAGDPQPPTYVPNANQFVAFAYTNSGGVSPTIANLDYPRGIPVTSNGLFRIADVPPSTGNFKIGVWYDSNGDGVIDAGDLFGSVQTTCSSQANVCGRPQVNVARVGSSFTLP